MTTEPTLRDHARGAVRDEVSKRAWMLFAEQGYDATTVDQIAAAAGMSRRTFFRYFAGKDELVLDRLVESGDRIATALKGRPADEPVWDSLRTAFDEIVRPQESHPERSRTLQVMLRTEPALSATVQHRRERWSELLTPLVAARLPGRRGSRAHDVRAAAIVASALACLDVAQDAWIDHPQHRLGTLLDQAMDTVGPGSPA